MLDGRDGRDGLTVSTAEPDPIVRRRQVSHPETDGQPTKKNGGGAERHVKSPLSPDAMGANGGRCKASEHHSHWASPLGRLSPSVTVADDRLDAGMTPDSTDILQLSQASPLESGQVS